MTDTQEISCQHCGSINTELRNTPPGRGIIQELKEHLFSINPLSMHVLPGGLKYIVCKDCGHVTCIHIR